MYLISIITIVYFYHVKIINFDYINFVNYKNFFEQNPIHPLLRQINHQNYQILFIMLANFMKITFKFLHQIIIFIKNFFMKITIIIIIC